MPVTPFEIMMAKVWSMGLVVLVVSGLSLMLMVKGVLGVPIEGSIPLFMLGVVLSLFATTSIGIFMGTIARSMPQLGLLMIWYCYRYKCFPRFHAARKYAAGGAGYYADHADDAFCQPCPGYSLSRRRFEYRLAAVPDPAGDRRRVLPDSAVTLQKNDWHNGVNIIAGWRLRLIRPTNDDVRT